MFPFPGDEWKRADNSRASRRGMIRWDPRPGWQRVCEYPFRKFYIINYDPFITIPEEEFVWDAPERNMHRESPVAVLLLMGYFLSILIALWIMSYIFS